MNTIENVLSKETFALENKDFQNFPNTELTNFKLSVKLYSKNEHQWKKIRRYDDPSKNLSPRALGILSNAVHKLRSREVIFYTHDYLSEHLTDCKPKQNLRLLNQLREIFDIEFHRKIKLNGKNKMNVFVISFTAVGKNLLDDVENYYASKSGVNLDKNVQKYGQKCPDIRTKMSVDTVKNVRSIYSNKDYKKEKIDEEIDKEKFESKNEKISDLSKSIFLNSKAEGISFDEPVVVINDKNGNQKGEGFSEGKNLEEFYPLSEEDWVMIKKISGRDYSLQAMNEIFRDMLTRVKDRVFKSRSVFLSYMGKVFKMEMRNPDLISGGAFRINPESVKHISGYEGSLEYKKHAQELLKRQMELEHKMQKENDDLWFTIRMESLKLITGNNGVKMAALDKNWFEKITALVNNDTNEIVLVADNKFTKRYSEDELLYPLRKIAAKYFYRITIVLENETPVFDYSLPKKYDGFIPDNVWGEIRWRLLKEDMLDPKTQLQLQEIDRNILANIQLTVDENAEIIYFTDYNILELMDINDKVKLKGRIEKAANFFNFSVQYG